LSKSHETSTVQRRAPTWLVGTAFLGLLVFIALIYGGYTRSRLKTLSVGESLPDIEFTTFDGQIMDSRSLQGKVVVVNFWASWCEPCEDEAAGLEKAWNSYLSRDDILFMGIDYMDTEREAKNFLDTYGITYPNGPDLRSTISNAFRIYGVPETYVFDRQGKLAYRKIGPFTSTAEIYQIIDPLLK